MKRVWVPTCQRNGVVYVVDAIEGRAKGGEMEMQNTYSVYREPVTKCYDIELVDRDRDYE